MLEESFLLCKKIAKIFSSYEHDDSDVDVVAALAKIKKVFEKFGYQDDIILKSLVKFKHKYRNLDESWYRKPVIFLLYNEGTLVKGPGLYFSHFYRMASKIDRHEKTNYKIKLTNLVLGLIESEPDIALLEKVVLGRDPLLNESKFRDIFLWACKELKTQEVEEFFRSEELKHRLEEIS